MPDRNDLNIEIIPFTSDLKEEIKLLNYEWLEMYFHIEPSDILSLSNPQEEIIDKGGFIYYAKLNDVIIGTASLIKTEDNIFELAKMAVKSTSQGKGVGGLLLEHCISESKKMGIAKLILYSNTKLESALHLYRKFAFKQVPLEHAHYQRANIKMELVL
jgi:N-acetylglutamate synthase-like GNAT family acetyltransferase